MQAKNYNIFISVGNKAGMNTNFPTQAYDKSELSLYD